MRQSRKPDEIFRRIPYSACYEEMGMIRAGENTYSVMYSIDPIDQRRLLDFQSKVMESRVSEFLNGMEENVSMQFLVHNRFVEEDKALKGLLYDPKKVEGELSEAVRFYNEVLLDNAKAGHNNARKAIYLILSLKADTPDEAADKFRKMEEIVREKFSRIYGLTLTWQSLMKRLKVLYGIFHPGGGVFAERIDPEGKGMAGLKELRLSGLGTKEIIAPESWNASGKLLNHCILNEKYYARALFLNLIPKEVPPSFVTDLTSISAGMLFSVSLEPVDLRIGFSEAAERIKRNTLIHEKPKRDTLLDRKNHTMIRVEESREHTEKTYYEKAALKVLKEAKDRDEKVFFTTVTIVLFSSDLETLEKDTEFLRLSAARFSAGVSCLDLQQLQGFQSALPLGNVKVDAFRLLSSSRVKNLIPTGILDTVKRDGQYMGLNAVNDTLILLNRKNNVNMSGIITGVGKSGKTYEGKREILNALIGSKDRVTIVTDTDEYDGFVKALGGEIIPFPGIDLLEMEDGYGLVEDDLMCRKRFLSAAVSACAKLSEYPSLEEIKEAERKADEEVRRLTIVASSEHMKGDALREYILRMKSDYPMIKNALLENEKRYGKVKALLKSRFTVIRAEDQKETLFAMEMLWNETIRDKKKNRSGWIFLDPGDILFTRESFLRYLLWYQESTSLFETVFTMTIGRMDEILSDPVKAAAMETFLMRSGYIKLLNEGPRERKKLCSILSIPQVLTPYISNTQPGKGILLTPSSHVPFNDNYMELYPGTPLKELLTA